MKYTIFLIMGMLLCSAANANSHDTLPEQWKDKELVHYSDELFANEDMYYKLLANHYYAGDIKDEYWLAEYILSEFGKKDEFDKITNPLRQRKYLRTNIIPQLKKWSLENKGAIQRPEYVLYRMPAKGVSFTSVYAKLETWMAYTPYNTSFRRSYMWRDKGFGLNARHATQTIGNKTYTYCDNNMDLLFPDYFLGNTEVDISFPDGLRPSVGNVGSNKSCTYIIKSETEDEAIDLLDALEKGVAIYWVVKMPESSFTTTYSKVKKNGQLTTSINTNGKATVEGLLLKDAADRVLWAWTPQKNAVSITADQGSQARKSVKAPTTATHATHEVKEITLWDIRDGDTIDWNGTTENVSVSHPNGDKSTLLVSLQEWDKYKSSKPMINYSKQKRPMTYQGKPFKKGFSFSLF
ncbi:MAG: hypothetical protein ACJAS1_001844 [Oleiphilaceae bacterium]|jgi:hypothetical protein